MLMKLFQQLKKNKQTNIFKLLWFYLDFCWALVVSPPLSLVEQKPEQADRQTHQQEAQHHPNRPAPPRKSWRLVIIRLRVNSPVR